MTELAANRNWIWVFGRAAALDEVVAKGRMGFTERAHHRVAVMGEGDRVVLYASRGAWANPPRDVSRVVGTAVLSADPSRIPVKVLGETYPWSAPFEVVVLVENPREDGAPVRPAAPRLSFVRRPEVWGLYFRNSPLEVSDPDFEVLAGLLK